MPRKLTIVGLGEALLVEHSDRTEAAGIASAVAIHAVRLGHVGVAISRVGQDEPGAELLELLRSAGVETEHVQSDPDLATGRVIERAIGGRIARYLGSSAAFDNLQADFDLEDVAQKTDAVVYGMLTRRGGQTRSEENRFLGFSTSAVKVLDLTNRGEAAPERGHALSGLELADALILDLPGLQALCPGVSAEIVSETADTLIQQEDLAFVGFIEPAGQDDRLTVRTADGSADVTVPRDRSALAAAIVGLVARLLAGAPLARATELAARVAAHAIEHRDEPVPGEWMQ